MASNVVKWGLAGVLVLAGAVGGEALYLHHRNAVDQQAPAATPDLAAADPDNLVFVRGEHPMSFKDERDLKGRTLWVHAGGQMVYYPYAGGHIDFAHGQGVLRSPDAIKVVDAVEAVAKKDVLNRVPYGDKQVFLVFTKAGDAKEYATPVGTKEGADYTFATDTIYFYDDPHTLYSHWSPQVWQAVNAHKVIAGMNEMQAYMALGQVATEGKGSIGDQTVTFDNSGHPVDITFEHGKAVKLGEIK